jgi:hypothetical protein
MRRKLPGLGLAFAGHCRIFACYRRARAALRAYPAELAERRLPAWPESGLSEPRWSLGPQLAVWALAVRNLSSWLAKALRSARLKGAGPPVETPVLRNSSSMLRMVSRAPMLSVV